MRISITGINFKYGNGYDQEYTGVELQYITTGFKFSDNTAVEISKSEYEANKSNSDGLKGLIVDSKLDEANDYIVELNTYKDSLGV